MGDKLRRLPAATATFAAIVLTGVLGAALAQPATSATRRDDAPVAKFTVSSLNVLGANHTVHSRKHASGTVRIVRASHLLDLRHVDVTGFQELQVVQLEKFQQVTKGSWGLYPALQLSRRDSENSIGWRKDRFTLVKADTVDIPYFNGSIRQMPVVLLREKATGLLAWFTNFHNPADTRKHPGNARWRAEATRIEIALQNRLADTGIPRFMTGDMNEHGSYFCRVTKEAPLSAARGGYWRNGVCYPERATNIDWILGSPELTWSNYHQYRGTLVRRTTDHPMMVGDVTVDGARFPAAQGAAPVVPSFAF